MSRAALGLAPATTSLIRNLMPLVRFEVDNAIVASVVAPPATSQRGELSGRPPANDRDEQRGAHGVSNKTRKCQKDSTKHGGDAGGLQMHRPQALLGEGGAEAREVGASGLSQQRSRYQPCWRHGWDRLWSGRCDDLCRLFGASLWISAVACLHIGMGTDLCLSRFPSAGSH
jgi:hypothetical protein